jgi:hypothetical protein
MIREMEALLINAMGLHNIRPGVFPAAEEWKQVRDHEREVYIRRLVPGRGRPAGPKRPT